MSVVFGYADESDPGPYPIPPDAHIEGGPNAKGDRHVLVLDQDNGRLYELFSAFPLDGGKSWKASSGAVFDLKVPKPRPAGWTSADAAGLPILPGLARYDEICGAIKDIFNDTRSIAWDTPGIADNLVGGPGSRNDRSVPPKEQQ